MTCFLKIFKDFFAVIYPSSSITVVFLLQFLQLEMPSPPIFCLCPGSRQPSGSSSKALGIVQESRCYGIGLGASLAIGNLKKLSHVICVYSQVWEWLVSTCLRSQQVSRLPKMAGCNSLLSLSLMIWITVDVQYVFIEWIDNLSFKKHEISCKSFFQNFLDLLVSWSFLAMFFFSFPFYWFLKILCHLDVSNTLCLYRKLCQISVSK